LCIAANLVDPDSMAITWDDIGGLKDVIEQIKETVIFPFKSTIPSKIYNGFLNNLYCILQ
jgi:ATP-dependent 26S proteasome regulatory subunit